MKLSIERGTLLKALAQAQSVVERRNTIPILANVLIEAEGAQVSFRATDLDIEVVDRAAAMVERAGATTVSAVMLHEIVRKLPDGALVNLTEDAASGRLAITAGRSSFNLATLPREDFPVMASSEYSSNFSAPAAVLRRLFDKAKFAISTEETRYYLNGLYLHTVAEAGVPLLRAVATDGHRLALAETPAPEGAAGGPGVIVPRKTIDQVRRLLDDGSGPVEVMVSPQKIRFEFGQASLTSKVIDGAFPDYMRVIPKGNDKQADIDNAVFASAVDRVATISAEKSRSVKLAFDLDRVTLTVRNMEAGQGVEEVEIGYSEEPFEIGFNARYLLDVAGQITGETAHFKFADPASPTLVLDPGDPGVQYVLMPLRV